MRPVRSFLVITIRYRSGLSFAICEHTACANALDSFQPSRSCFFHDHRCDDVQSLAPRRLTKGHEPERFQTLLHFFRRFDNCVESDVWRGVEIENQPPRNRWMARLFIPL